MSKRIIGTPIPKNGKKKKTPSISILKKRLWVVFAEYIKKRDKGICFTCGKRAEGSAYHAGHFIAKSVGGIELYFNEKNVHGQCMRCNINLGGNQYIYGQKLGEETVKELFALKQLNNKWSVQDYLNKIAEYQQKVLDL